MYMCSFRLFLTQNHKVHAMGFYPYPCRLPGKAMDIYKEVVKPYIFTITLYIRPYPSIAALWSELSFVRAHLYFQFYLTHSYNNVTFNGSTKDDE